MAAHAFHRRGGRRLLDEEGRRDREQRDDRAAQEAGANAARQCINLSRAGGGDAYSIVPSLQPGALLQDWTARAHRPALLSEEFSAYVAREAFGSPAPEIHAPLFWHAFVSPDGADLVTDADNIYLFDNPRLAARPFFLDLCRAAGAPEAWLPAPVAA